MNAIFVIIFVLSSAVICIKSPQSYLGVLLSGAENCIKTCLTLLCVYIVWMGICAVAEDCKITERIARLVMPLIKKVFKSKDKTTNEYLATNLTCNFLGFGSAATPYAVKAVSRLGDEDNNYAPHLLFVINATSIQLIPATVIAMRAAANSNAPSDIILPSFFTSALSTAIAVIIFICCNKIINYKNRTHSKKSINADNLKRA